ncbi:MAG: pyrroline-5-carboxylate reductase [Parvibaculaceae bacterium]
MSQSVPLKGKLVLLGAGKMGGALLQGWLERGVAADQVVILDPGPPPEIQALIDKHGLKHNPAPGSLKSIEVLLVAVKPQIMGEALKKLGTLPGEKPLIISVAAGKTIASFEQHFGKDAAVIRSIPNTPSAVGRGITAMALNGNVSTSRKALAQALLEAVGEVVTVEDESLIDVATAVSGSGPAYVFYVAECLAEAGEKAGLPKDLAVRLARATVSGAGELMRQSGLPAATLRQNVTSPKGTTHEALQVLMAEDGIGPLFVRAVAAATRRSRELAS